MNKKFHYYSFTFLESNTYTSIYIGYNENHVSIPQIKEAKKIAGVTSSAVLLTCSYLGKMTINEMEMEETKTINEMERGETDHCKAIEIWHKLKNMVHLIINYYKN